MAPAPCAAPSRDAAILLGALTGVDPEDSATRRRQGKSLTDYTQFCDPNGLKGARIGVAQEILRLQRCRRCPHGAMRSMP